MNTQNGTSEYKENLRSDLYAELYAKIGKHRFKKASEGFFEKIESRFENFVNRIAIGNIFYIKDFPLYLKSTNNIPIEIILEKTEIADIDGKQVKINMFIYNLIKYAIMIDECDQLISENALISISKLLKSHSDHILELVLDVGFESGEEIKTFYSELPKLIPNLKTDDHKRALLRCIPAIPDVITHSEQLFIDFFSEQLRISDPNRRLLKKTATSSASKIICMAPESNFSKQIISDLPFDKNDPELSKYCFKALIAQCNIGIFDCFDLSQIINFACDVEHRTSYDAVNLLISASFYSIEVCRELLNNAQMFEYLLQNMINLKFVCLLIINIASKGAEFANSLTFLFDSFLNLYFENELSNKICIVRTICNIILYSDIKFPEGNDPLYDILLDGIYLDNDVIIIIIDALVRLNYTGEDFHEALIELTGSDITPVAYQATIVLNQIDQLSN